MGFSKIYEFKGADDGILSITRKDNSLYIAGEDNIIRIFSLFNYKEIKAIKAHSRDILSLKLSKDNKYLFSSSRDGIIKQWDLDLNLIKEYPPHNSDVNIIDFIDENTFISASDDATIRIWKTGKDSYKEIKPNIGDINGIKVTNNYIFAGGSKLIIYSKDFKEIKSDDNYIYGINLIKQNGNDIFISTHMEKYLEIWSEETLEKKKRIKMTSWINDILFFKDKIIIANSNIISIYDKDFNLIEQNDFLSDEVYALESYENKIITASNDSYIRIWEIK
ncbi:MAG: hypothetical protein K6357_01785 [Elusimicrobiota bacterium]